MQKFTRALTREIEAAGERLAVTLSEEGMTLRPVGGRRPPHTLSWDALVYACVSLQGTDLNPDAIAEAVKALKAGGDSTPRPKPAAAAEQTTAPADHPAPDHPKSSLSALLARLDHWLKAHRARYYHSLLPGATSADCHALQTALGKPLPAELHTWLTWHNGQNPDVEGGLEENWIPMSTTEIAEVKKELDDEAHAGWNKEWIPFLDNDNDSFLCLDPTRAGCAVVECWRGKHDHPTAAPSLAAWVEHVLTGLEQGKYTEDPERGGMHRR